MAAVPIYVWNGSAWQETGPTIPASPIKYQASAPSSPSTGDIWVDSDGDVTTGSQQFQRFRFVASGGETTISGADANGAVLAYTAGLEQVVLNGAVLVRGHDYTATTGTTITGLSPALVASDVLEVFSFIAFTVANTYTQSQVDGLLDSYIGLRLITPTSAVNGTVGATGAVTFSAVSSVSLNGCFNSTYENYKIVLTGTTSSTSIMNIHGRLRASGTDASGSNYNWISLETTGAAGPTRYSGGGQTVGYVANGGNGYFSSNIDISRPFTAATTMWTALSAEDSNSDQNLNLWKTYHTLSTSYDGITIYPASGTISGTVRVYGYKN